jgi:hypothetical protein
MQIAWVKIVSRLGTALVVSLGWFAVAQAQGPWKELTNPLRGVHLETCLLLRDGTVMCHEYGTNRWHRLSPNNKGSYIDGAWNVPPIREMPKGRDGRSCPEIECPYEPLYFASAVLPSGQVVVIGGELNPPSNGAHVFTNIGFVYDPVADEWSSQLMFIDDPKGDFAAGKVGDAQSVILEDGTMLLASALTTNIAAFKPMTQTFTPLNPSGKNTTEDVYNNEENWNILADGTVLTVDARIASSFEIYDPVANSWARGDTSVNLVDWGAGSGNSQEVGPAVLRPDGTLVYFSANSSGLNAVYDTGSREWLKRPATRTSIDFPLFNGQEYAFAVADGPASLLPNGDVLVMASPVSSASTFNTPSHFFRFDGTTLALVESDPDGADRLKAYQGRMLLLPKDGVLLTAFNESSTEPIDVVRVYTDVGRPQDAWRPAISSAPKIVTQGRTYPISGTLFNGFSEGASYGDDAQMSSNYPLVRITSRAGNVFYARTYGDTRNGVVDVGDTEVVTTLFEYRADCPGCGLRDLDRGLSKLEVVVNGIPSREVVVFATAVPPLGATFSRFSGHAGDIGRGMDTGASITGRFSAPDGSLDLSARSLTVTIMSLFDEVGRSGEAVGNLPITLVADPRNNGKVGVFTTPSRSPFFGEVKIGAEGENQFTFHLKVVGATSAVPTHCSDTTLTSTFIFDDRATPPVVLTTAEPWRCVGNGNHLKTR